MINKYIFDYRLVLEEDPSLEKFVDVKTIDNLEERYDRGYRANPFADIKSTDINEEENDKNIKELVKEGIIDAEEKILKSMAPCDCKIQEDEEIFNATAI